MPVLIPEDAVEAAPPGLDPGAPDGLGTALDVGADAEASSRNVVTRTNVVKKVIVVPAASVVTEDMTLCCWALTRDASTASATEATRSATKLCMCLSSELTAMVI